MDIPMTLIVALAVIGGTAALAFWVWMLVDCIRHEPRDGNDRIVWLIVIVAAKFVGALVYFFVRRSRRPSLEAG